MNIPYDAFIIKSEKITYFKPQSKIIPYEKKIWEEKFPTLEQNMQKLQLTDVGIYSIAKPEISNSMINFIEEICENNLKIPFKELNVLETHGGIGGFSIQLAKKCKFVNILDIDTLHVKIIKNNLDLYNISNYNVLNVDTLDFILGEKSFISTKKYDLVVCDPPWGDLYYKYKNLKLGINNVNISYIVNQIIDYTRVFILMAPKNFDIHDFIKNVNSKKIIIQKLNKHFLIAVLK